MTIYGRCNTICDRCNNECKYGMCACGNFIAKKQTNFDRITSSPEVLARFLRIIDASLCYSCKFYKRHVGCFARDEDNCLIDSLSAAEYEDGSYECWLKWLKQEENKE